MWGGSFLCPKKPASTLHLLLQEDETELRQKIESFIDPALQTSHSHTSLDDFMQREDIAEDVKALYLLALEGTTSQEVFQSGAYHERVEKRFERGQRAHP